ncbi:hypothetical protein THC_0764 [Caldimicrobium thiodismutans]|uniref:UspA domain-containing protein n=1 Tax=Caldimicrobium thiodismutans TaxID=1653476 RepID=A0A0U5AGN7_9BACT|nr:hypothetical protein [Caldimicrobium thiodismutans]BAU23155.1 hypothetical protein THC_0764 [Caldimicrobium thiodismutans]
MFKKILAEIKGFTPEDLTAFLALDLAQNLKASLYFLVTYEKEEELAKAETFLNGLLVKAEERNLKVEAHFKKEVGLKDLTEILKKEKIELAFLPLRDLKKSLKLPTNLALVKFVHLGRLSPKRILIILEENFKALKNYENFLKALLKTYPHKRVYIISIGKDKKFSALREFLKKQPSPHEWEAWMVLSLKKLIFKILSKRIDFIIFPVESLPFWQIKKRRFVKNLIGKSPCNLIIFKPGI